MLVLALGPTNKYPMRHYSGRDLTKADGHRFFLAGHDINPQQFRMMFIRFTGDMMFQLQEFEQPFSFMNMPNEVCNACRAVGRSGACSAFDFRDDADWVDTERGGAVDWPNDQPLLTIPGAHRQAMFEEMLHDDHLGGRPILTGGCMAR